MSVEERLAGMLDAHWQEQLPNKECIDGKWIYARRCDCGWVGEWEAWCAHVATLLAEVVEGEKAGAWDEACKALAWCLENGPMESALPYVAEHNPYRAGEAGAVGEQTNVEVREEQG